jgi:hypothetical protein
MQSEEMRSTFATPPRTLPSVPKPRKYKLSIGFSRFCRTCNRETLQHFYLDYRSGAIAYSRCSHCHGHGLPDARAVGWA